MAGFGAVDLKISRSTSVEDLATESPFGATVNDEGISSPMTLVDFPIFVSTDDTVILSGRDDIMSGVRRVITTHDDTHFEVGIDSAVIFERVTVDVSHNDMFAEVLPVSEIQVIISLASEITAKVRTTASYFTLRISFLQTRPEWNAPNETVEFTVIAADKTNCVFTASFLFTAAKIQKQLSRQFTRTRLSQPLTLADICLILVEMDE